MHTAADLPTGIPDTNGTADVFVRDRVAGTTALVSVAHDGTAAAGDVDLIAMSEDGRRVAFNSRALNLVPGFVDGSPGQVDVYLRDLNGGTTELVNASAGTSVSGGNGEAQIALGPYPMSADGRYLLFYSPASNLVPSIAGLNGNRNLYVRDVVSDTTTLVSVSHDASKAVGSSGHGSISADGRYVAFASSDRDVVSPPSSPFGQPDVYRRDLQSKANLLVSVSSSGTSAGNGNSHSPIMSRAGSVILFQSVATDLVPGLALSFYAPVYARDIDAGTTEMIDINAAGTGVGDQSSYATDISPDGRYVASTRAPRTSSRG